jgi:hypothetical protein
MGSPPPTTSPLPLLGDTFQRKRKQVYRAPTFADHTGMAGASPYSDNLLEFRRRIEQGLELPPRFYRNGIGKTPDDLLQHTGVKHIHLGAIKGDVLLFVMEFDDFVVLLEIADHRANFHQVPVGDTLKKNHIAPLQSQLPSLAVTAAQKVANAADKLTKAAKLAAAREKAKVKGYPKKPGAP